MKYNYQLFLIAFIFNQKTTHTWSYLNQNIPITQSLQEKIQNIESINIDSITEKNLNFNQYDLNEEIYATQMSYKTIINLYIDFKNLTKETTRYLLNEKKYEKLYKENQEEVYKKKLEKYSIKLANQKNVLTNFFTKNKKELDILTLAAKLKGLKIDEQLFQLAYKYTNNLIQNNEKISTKESKNIYYKNKKNYENNKILIDEKIEDLQNEIKKIKKQNINIAIINSKNIKNHNLYQKKEDQKLPKNYYKIYKKLSKLVEKSYFSQIDVNDERNLQNNVSKEQIKELKQRVKTNHEKAYAFMKKYKKELDEMLIKYSPQYYSNHLTLFAPSILKKQLEFIYFTDLCMYFILAGKQIPELIEIRQVLKNENEYNNKVLKNILKTLIELENL